MAECFNIYIEDISCNGKGQIENLALLHILKGDTGDTGLSAYELALQIGFIGTLEEWIASLKGEKGEQGDKGEQGLQGIQGIQGEQGYTPYVGENGNWFINGIDTNIHAQGLKGDKGDKGDNSFSPYIDPNTLTWWVFNDETKQYEDTGISVNDFLKKDGSIPLNIGYVPTTPLGIATKGYVDDQVTLYNITNEIPLPAGQYYTLTTAIAAIPSNIKKLGLKIIFQSSATDTETWEFFNGTISNITNVAYWRKCINSMDLDFNNPNYGISIDENKLSYYVGAANGAIAISNRILKVPIGQIGAGSNFGIYLYWNNNFNIDNTNPYPEYIRCSLILESNKDITTLLNKNYTLLFFNDVTKYPNNTRIVNLGNNKYKLESIIKDVRSIKTNNSSFLDRIFIGCLLANYSPIVDEDLVITILHSQLLYDEYPEYSIKSTGRTIIEELIGKSTQEITSNLIMSIDSNNDIFNFVNGSIKLGERGYKIPEGYTGKDTAMYIYFPTDYKIGEKVIAEVYFSKSKYFDTILYAFENIYKSNQKIAYPQQVSIGNGLYKSIYEFIPSIDESEGITTFTFAFVNTNNVIATEDINFNIINSSYYQNYYKANKDIVNNLIETKTSELLNAANIKTVINVSADENAIGFDFVGKNAVQEAIDSITDNSFYKRYIIRAANGIYKVVNSSEYIGAPNYPAMICMKDYVDVEGQSTTDTIFWAELPYNDADIDSLIEREKHQTLWNYAKDAKLKNCTLVAKNIRYTIHQDAYESINSNRYYENVDVIFIGDKGYTRSWGLGTWNGEENYINGGKSISSGTPLSIHNNSKFEKPTKYKFENHKFISNTSADALYIESLGSLVNDEIELIGCCFEGVSYIITYADNWLRGNILQGYSSFNHADWRLKGYSNSPFLFKNTVNGESLKIKSSSTGVNSKVRFNVASTAFNDLIKNPNNLANTYLLPEINCINGYLYKDGCNGLAGWANGCRDLSGRDYIYDSGVIYNSLGVNLGDCSVANKNLIIEIDGVEYTITFNKDYRAISNADILTEINTVINNHGVATLESYGRNYYPEMSDVIEIAYNSSSTSPIIKGTIVTRDINGRIRPCQANEKILGVSLDDIATYEVVNGELLRGYGRIMKYGYISINTNEAHYALAASTANAGEKMDVVDGILEKNVNGRILLRDNNIVSINC